MIKSEIFYAVMCDRCGKYHEVEDSCFFTDEQSALEYSENDEWRELNKKHYCPNCYIQDDKKEFFTIKDPYPKELNKLLSFINNILQKHARLNEFEDRFVVSFYLNANQRFLKYHEHIFITELLGSRVKLFEYKRSDNLNNSECVISINN